MTGFQKSDNKSRSGFSTVITKSLIWTIFIEIIYFILVGLIASGDIETMFNWWFFGGFGVALVSYSFVFWIFCERKYRRFGKKEVASLLFMLGLFTLIFLYMVIDYQY